MSLVKMLNVMHLGHELDIARDYHYLLVPYGNSIVEMYSGFVEADVNIIIAVARNIRRNVEDFVDRNSHRTVAELDLLSAQAVSLVTLIIGLLDLIAITTGYIIVAIAFDFADSSSRNCYDSYCKLRKILY